MKRIWVLIGRVAFWVLWPASWLALKFSTRTKVLIVSGGEVLLVKNWLGDGRWCLPGGGLRPKEHPARGATREVREEVGLHLETEQLKLLNKGKATKSGLTYKYIAYVYKPSHKPATKAWHLEIVDLAWLPLISLEQLATEPSVGLAVAAWQHQS